MANITTERLELGIDSRSFRITELRNLVTNELVATNAEERLLVRFPLRVSEPEVLTVQSVSSTDDGLELTFLNDCENCRAGVRVTASEDGAHFRLRLATAEPVWLVEWQLYGLRLEEIIVPALGGQALTKDMPAETTLSYKYPFWLNAQFLIAAATHGGIWIRSKDARPRLKLARVRKDDEGFALTYGFEAPGPLESTTVEAEWYLDGYEGGWQVAVEKYQRWMEKAFGLVPLTRNPYFPGWARKINFVLEIWGAHKDRLHPLHTFEQMIDRVQQWSRLHTPERTLLYLPGFAENGIDSHAPDYNPSPQLGGESAFKRLVDVAHNLGYRVMVHTNVLAMTFTHPLYQEFKKHQVVDVFGRPQGWGLDIDGDWLTEPYFAYINPGAQEWGNLMEEVLGQLVEKFGIDAIHLDQTLLAFNVSRGPNFLTGMREHVQRLQSAFPQVLFAGEGLHEQVAAATPLAQIHGLDSIAEVHGMEGQKPWRRPHPVSTYLFGKYTRFVAHLLTKHPSHPMFRLQEAAYAELDVLPALVLYDSGQSMDLPEVKEMLARAERLSDSERSSG